MTSDSYVIAVASLGDYRSEVVSELHSKLGNSLTIYAGHPAYDSSIRLLEYQRFGVVELKNHYFLAGLLVQSVPIIRLLCAKSLIMDLNPRVPHVWIITALRRLAGRRTMLWGHAWSKAGARSRGEKVRSALRRLSTGLVTYTEQQAEVLRTLHPTKVVVAAPNALYRRDQMAFSRDRPRFRILYVGRLVDQKKPQILLEAFKLLLQDKSNLILTFVGDGPARIELERMAGRLNNAKVEFLGHVSDFERLREIYSEAIVSVSPGYVGLSITQSLAFGVPMIVSQREDHSPEIEAMRLNFNSRFFETDDANSLAATLMSFSDEANIWANRGESIAEDCRVRYSSERMASGLIKALQGFE